MHLKLTSPGKATVMRLDQGLRVERTSALFGVSATYHRGRWSPRTNLWLRRLDHSSIFLLIAGSYTPFTLLLLEGQAREVRGHANDIQMLQEIRTSVLTKTLPLDALKVEVPIWKEQAFSSGAVTWVGLPGPEQR